MQAAGQFGISGPASAGQVPDSLSMPDRSKSKPFGFYCGGGGYFRPGLEYARNRVPAGCGNGEKGSMTLSRHSKKALLSVLLISLIALPTVASYQETAAADVVASAFMQVRQTAQQPSLERMRRNTFREQACKGDTNFPHGMIRYVVYQTSDPADLPESAQRLATWPDKYRIVSRFGVGVCLVSDAGQPKYSIVIAIYRSRWNSFWVFLD
jgi:hypothetical protein